MLIQGAGSHDWTISNSVKFCLVTGSPFLPAYKCDIIKYTAVYQYVWPASHDLGSQITQAFHCPRCAIGLCGIALGFRGA